MVCSCCFSSSSHSARTSRASLITSLSVFSSITISGVFPFRIMLSWVSFGSNSFFADWALITFRSGYYDYLVGGFFAKLLDTPISDLMSSMDLSSTTSFLTYFTTSLGITPPAAIPSFTLPSIFSISI